MTYYDRAEGFNPLCLAALRYAALGLRVFSLAPGTRIPLKGSHGYRDATLSPETIKGWWWRIPRANVGIATGRASGL
jgi:hypothetical protein